MSRVSSIRSAARGTFSAPSQVPIRWRLAGGSALLTLIILCGFAGVVGTLIADRIHADFDDQVKTSVGQLHDSLQPIGTPHVLPGTAIVHSLDVAPDPDEFAASSGAVIRIVSGSGVELAGTKRTAGFGMPAPVPVESGGYRVETRRLPPQFGESVGIPGYLYVQYGRPVASTEATIRRVRLFLVIGVLSGAGLALLAGLTIARRAMAPIAELTATAREIERTRDPAQRIPEPEADDEVAELARTLDGMLQGLDESRRETESALIRQREFVADASHELRTPLTSVLANLELLADHLEGEPRETARSALRSSQRMRRLVADLLLLARADAERQAPHVLLDLGDVLVEAAAELGALADGHELNVDPSPAVVSGARDELHRLALNLMENAIRHTPAGTQIHATVAAEGGRVLLIVEDDGPGIPADLRDRVFERFVRGAGDRGGSSGLGLSIVRAVADSHGGTVRVTSPTGNDARVHGGTRFEVSLPVLDARPATTPFPVLS